MNNGSKGDPESEPVGLWERLDAFLHTDPHDAGCDLTMEMLDVYAELIAVGENPVERFPGLHAHFVACGPCAEDLRGLLVALTGDDPGPYAPA
jgi:hypothetical protein